MTLSPVGTNMAFRKSVFQKHGRTSERIWARGRGMRFEVKTSNSADA